MESLLIEILKGFGVSAVSVVMVLGLLMLSKEALISRLTKSIEHEYAVKLEDFKFQLEAKKKAELVAKLLAHWIRFPEDQEELNRMALECFLWLPDKIASDLSDLLAHNREHEVSIRSVIISIRQLLNNGNKEYMNLKDYEVILFTNQSKELQYNHLLNSLGLNLQP
ncbi:hypothetical protein F3J02_03840 [Acinetobacter sp. Tr-809]|uniref:hypothetical protein n=1 Tax=Acinetobacter sp. Tr-809 TaxID=2608324 RepID=UPI00141F641F|nr:hypothetical protein [Acinetobacter sp. Tr-809]NIE95621.1 hypothetical protein [Acinetobacter sp. Tr-809]